MKTVARAGAFPPGPPALPVLGHLAQFRSNPLGFVRGVAHTYGPAATLQLGRQTIVLLSRPEAVRAVLVEHARVLTSAEFNVVLRPVLGRGLLTTDGEEHRRLRRLVQPAFGRKRVEGYRDTMVAHAERMLATWRLGETLEVGRELQRLTLGIMAEVLLGIRNLDDVGALGQAFAAATESARGASLLFRVLARPQGNTALGDHAWRGPLTRVPLLPQHRLAQARGTLDGIVAALVARRRAAALDPGNPQPGTANGRPVSPALDTGDVASALLAARDEDGALDDDEIRDQLVTLLGASHATTAVALCWTLYLLSQNPRVATALHGELHARLGGRAPTVEDLERLPFLELVLTEALRLYPPAWAMGRLAHEEVDVAGYRLPAGTLLMLSPWVTHHLPDLFAEPRRFCPERFDPTHGELHPPYAYFPFGAGPRMCIGAAFATLEAKVLLATILQRVAPTMVPGHPVRPRPIVVLRPAHGMRMTLHPAG